MRNIIYFLTFGLVLLLSLSSLSLAFHPVTIKDKEVGKITTLDNGWLIWDEKVAPNTGNTSVSPTMGIHLWLPDGKLSNIKISGKMRGYAYDWKGDVVYYDWGDRENIDFTKPFPTDKFVKWGFPPATATSTSMTFYTINTFATNVAIGGDKTVAWSLSGTFNNYVKVLYSDVTATGKVDDPLKPGTKKNVEDTDVKRKFSANPNGLLVTDKDVVVWWTKKAFNRSICTLKKTAKKPVCFDSAAEKVFSTEDGSIVWYNNDLVFGNYVKILPGDLIPDPPPDPDGTETAATTGTDSELPENTPGSENINDNIITYSDNISGIKVTHSGHIIWWRDELLGDKWIKILYKGAAEVIKYDGHVKDVKINSAETISWISGDQIKILRKDATELAFINEKADHHAVTKNGIVAWSGHRPFKYWVKVLFPGQVSPHVYEQWVDGMAELGPNKVVWWGNTYIVDGDKKTTEPYFSLMGPDCYLPTPIAGENGCSKAGNFDKAVDLVATTDPEDVIKSCYASVKYKWEVVSTPRDSTKPTITGSSSLKASFNVTLTNGYQGWYEFRFCVSGDTSINICDTMGVKMVPEDKALGTVPCRQDRAKLFSCSINPEQDTGSGMSNYLPFIMSLVTLGTFYLVRRNRISLRYLKIALFLAYVLFATGCDIMVPATPIQERGEYYTANDRIGLENFNGEFEISLGVPLDYLDKKYYFYYPAIIKPKKENGNYYVDIELFIDRHGIPEIRNYTNVPIVNGKISFTIENLMIPVSNTTLLSEDTNINVEVTAYFKQTGKIEGKARLNMKDANTISGILSGFIDSDFIAEKSDSVNSKIKMIRKFH